MTIMYTKIFRYHIDEQHYSLWFHLSRASNEIYGSYPDVSFKQSPKRKVGGGMAIEEVIVYPSRSYCEQMHDTLRIDPEICEMSQLFLKIVRGEIEEEEIGE